MLTLLYSISTQYEVFPITPVSNGDSPFRLQPIHLMQYMGRFIYEYTADSSITYFL